MLVIFSADKMFQYASSNIDSIMKRYKEYDGPYEQLNNKDVRFLLACPRSLNVGALASWIR